jgi:spore coat protein A, manganese oxidase
VQTGVGMSFIATVGQLLLRSGGGQLTGWGSLDMTEEYVGGPARVGRRTIFKAAGAGFGLYFLTSLGGRPAALEAAAAESSTMLAPGRIRKFAVPVLIPPAMPKAGNVRTPGGVTADYYEISVRQIEQQILPLPFPRTTV